jgi:hypothetical protein
LDPCLFLTFLGLGYRWRDEDGANLAEYIQTLLGYWSLVKSTFPIMKRCPLKQERLKVRVELSVRGGSAKLRE